MPTKKTLNRIISFVLMICMIFALGVLPVTRASASAPPDDPEPPVCTVRPIPAPVAGHFPASVFKYPYRANLYNNTSTTAAVGNGFAQTLTWDPPIETAFLTDTEYTATLLLVPNTGWSACGMPGSTRSFGANEITPDQIAGLPTEGVKEITYEYDDADMLIYIAFEATGPVVEAPDVVMYEDFSGGVHDDHTIGEGYFMNAQQANRQGLGNWRDNMTSVRTRDDGGSELVLGFKVDPSQTNSSNAYTKNNWITAGGVRTRGRSAGEGGGKYGSNDIIFENAFGYYEAAIKFPQANVVWGAFWLFSPATAASLSIPDGGSKYATEIDIIESPGYLTKFFNAAYHVYRTSWDRSNVPARDGARMATSEEVPIFSGYDETGVDIYDGEFHKIGLEWSPTDYKFYVDGILIGSWQDLDSHYYDPDVPYADWSVIRQNEGVMQNPAYIKLTVEAASWADETWDDDWAVDPTNPWRNVQDNAGSLGIFPNEGEMVVDYVYVLNGPKPAEPGEAKAIVGLSAAEKSYIDEPLQYDLTLTGDNVVTLELEFEVDDVLAFTNLETLNGFSIISDGAQIKWTPLPNGKWQGKTTVTYTVGGDTYGFSSASPEDILKFFYTAKQTGAAGMELTNVRVFGLNSESRIVEQDAILDAALATTEVIHSKFDLCKDGTIGPKDLSVIALYCQCQVGDPDWDNGTKVKDSLGNYITASMCDLNGDGIVDMLDLVELFLHYTV